MKLSIRAVIALAGALVAVVSAHEAQAAISWWIEGYVADVNLVDAANDGGSGQSVSIAFKSGYTGGFCNANPGYGGPGAAEIPSNSTQLFTEMVRMAQTAMLSGKKLRIKSTTPTGSLAQCKVAYMLMKP